MPQYFVNVSSRPLLHTVGQSPVLILGGIPNEKHVLMTDSYFKDFSLVELSIDSCWVGSFYCPQTVFTATIYDAIATESTLFIRQNQLVYYFTGSYPILHESDRSSGRWVRVLATECIKMLCPAHFHGNGSEYIMALTTGKHEGYVHFGTITDGQVSFEMLPRQQSVCEQIGVDKCSIIWAEYLPSGRQLLLLVEHKHPTAVNYCQVVRYNIAKDDLEILYTIPAFVPEAGGLAFLMILGTESYTNTSMAPKGMSYNPYNNLLFIWGNFLLQSSNKQNFIYLADFPKEQSIKYLVRSFRGDMAIVTETEEIWYHVEGTYHVYRLSPSQGWEAHVSLQVMHQSPFYASSETMVTLFYEGRKLYQLVYLINDQQGHLVKRPVPVEEILVFQQHKQYQLEMQGGDPVIPSDNLRADYYFYLASNWQSAGGVHIDMASYGKIYDLEAEFELPERIFLDKGTQYSFSVFLSGQGSSLRKQGDLGTIFQLQSQVAVGVELADPTCIEASVEQKILINRRSVLFSITLKDREFCYDQGISGHHLRKTSVMVNVVGSSGYCFQNTHQGPRLQGNLVVPVLIGCPPGKRLAFDITYTLEYNRLQNKHYFDCVHVDVEMPCFLFRDVFYPFFLIQDLVTGDSGSFQGSYVLKVVGGGPTPSGLRDYSEEEIYRFNSPLDRTHSRIWTTSTETTTEDLAFHILSHRSSGIQWLCLENSPCYDTIPQSISAPEFFFKVLVSNRAVDNSTYCDYQLTFLLHIHGLPLSAKRAVFIFVVSASVFLGLVVLYIIICFLWPLMVKGCNLLCWKVNNLIVSESYYTYVSSSGMLSASSRRPSMVSSSISTRVEEDKAERSQTLGRPSLT
ncbi:cation channel sperm-associated protein subunit gamma [Carlito syrichta]|uniref:Cation channel sperm-associated protein subunit gamma n=1 Tax=Carlito syrichta TaxID=1868482 RepID=A0A3Q0DM09_CARSF|nr:cation channel sperm-associated protein subunit gamma [Carlito syrichta]